MEEKRDENDSRFDKRISINKPVSCYKKEVFWSNPKYEPFQTGVKKLH